MTTLHVRATRDDASRDAHRVRFAFTMILLNVLALVVFAFVPWSDWRTGLSLILLDNAILLLYAYVRRDGMIIRLILFGLLVGFLELVADAWIVAFTNSLDYSPGGGPLLWHSPIWMPLAWEIVAVHLGFIGMLLFERWKFPGLLLAGILGAGCFLFYEEMAFRCEWWRYHNTVMFPGTNTPLAIIIGEFFIAMYIAYFATHTRHHDLRISFKAGACAGATTFISYAAPYWLILKLA
jgi:fluoride ion exporter CrcB/FEX